MRNVETAIPAHMKKRHYYILISLLCVVILPTFLSAVYLFAIATDQYSSRVSFSIRSEEITSPLEALGSLGQLSTGTTSDAGIVYEYIRSQNLLTDLQSEIDLRTIYSKPDFDPVFSFDPDKPIEDLLTYWRRMTHVAYDSGNGLIDITVHAFTPEDAHNIAREVMEASSTLVDRLSRIAQNDTTRFAEYELDRSRRVLAEARQKINDFRGAKQIVDPRLSLESQMGVLNVLQQTLADMLIEHDVLVQNSTANDPRLKGVQLRIEVIEDRIAEEREKIGKTTISGEDTFATLVGEYDAYAADLEFATVAFTAASSNYETAIAEARRKSRYLAAHIPPTIAQSSTAPNRFLLSFCVLFGTFLVWCLGLLSVYSAIDRR